MKPNAKRVPVVSFLKPGRIAYCLSVAQLCKPWRRTRQTNGYNEALLYYFMPVLQVRTPAAPAVAPAGCMQAAHRT